MNKKISICHIIFRLDYGGLENGLVNLINHLQEEKYRHIIICLKYASQFKERIKRKDVEIYELNKKDGKDLLVYAKVWRLLRKLRPDIVHTRNLPTIDMLLPAFLAGTKRLVHGEHGLDALELDGRYSKYNRLRWLTQLIVDQYICVSSDLVKWMTQQVGIRESKISLIYNGVDTELFRPGQPTSEVPPKGFAPMDPFVIGTLGRLEQVKDQVTLTKAFLRMLELRPELRCKLRLIIAGDGALRPEIEALLESADARSLAWLPGFYSNTPELYRTLSVFTLPSRREGISNTLLEAMASGLPVVATRVGGNPEIVDDGVTGQLVPSADPDGLATILLRYADDQEFANSQGRAAREKAVRHFSLHSMVGHYHEVYQSLGERK